MQSYSNFITLTLASIMCTYLQCVVFGPGWGEGTRNSLVDHDQACLKKLSWAVY